jgi:hypothetical protein
VGAMRVARGKVLEALWGNHALTARQISQLLGVESWRVDADHPLLAHAGLVRRVGQSPAGRVLWRATHAACETRRWGVGFWIWDLENAKPYVERAWGTLEEARAEREALLHYHRGTPWEVRLVVREIRAREAA